MSELFPVLILAGGLATRLRPLTSTIPKALIEINGEPFIVHQLRLLKKNNIHKVILCVGYLGHLVEDFLGNGKKLGIEIKYSYEPEKLLGTGGAIKNALRHVADNFFVLYGDSYLPCDYLRVQQSFLEQNRLSLMTVFKNEGQWDTSNVVFRNNEIEVYDKNNRTPLMNFIDYGLGVFNRKAFDYIPSDEVIDLATIYQDLLKNKQLSALEITERFYEVGSFAGIEELQYYLTRNELITNNKILTN